MDLLLLENRLLGYFVRMWDGWGWRSYTVKVTEVVFFLSFINLKIDTTGDVYPIVDLLLQLPFLLAFLFLF